MSDSTHDNVVSLSGQPIYVHDEESPWQEAQGEECIEEISAHLERTLGPIDTVFHEILSDTVHIDVHYLAPSEDNPYIRLVTSGMSDLPMHTPEHSRAPRHVELMITLPPHWQITEEAFKDEGWYWPVRLLKTLARLPHKFDTWLGWGHTVPHGDPAEAYASNTKLCCALLLPSITVDDSFHQLRINESKEITFYSVVPLYAEEMQLKLRRGSDELLKRFDKHGIDDLVLPRRRNVAKKLLGLI